MRFLALALSLWLAAPPLTAQAHPPTQLNPGADQGIADEILDFRKRMAAAIAAKDAVALRGMYAATFEHVLPSTKTEDRENRISAVIGGGFNIETAQPENLVVRAHAGGWVAIVTATTPLRSAADGTTRIERWMQVFVRSDTSWLLAASQSTRGIMKR